MTHLAAFYDAFIGAVIEGKPQALSAFLEDPPASADAIVYRNTMFRGAADALATAFPAVARLAGPAYFEAIAVAYVEAHPPRLRSLVGYGESFPDFLEAAPGIDQAPYLPDAARLDRAWLAAHLAVNCDPLTASTLAAVAPDALADACLSLHPSVQFVDLSWDVHAAWDANRNEGDTNHNAREVHRQRQFVALWRPALVVESQILSFAEAEFLVAIGEGAPLGEAAARALDVARDFDIGQVFAGTLAAGLFTAPLLISNTEQEPST